jgi:hypothetical protein
MKTSSKRLPAEPCACCGRRVPLTFHHLIPRKVHRRAHYRKNYDRESLNRGINVCRLCHRGIHKLYDEMRLAKEFASLEALLADEALATHFSWVARQRERS